MRGRILTARFVRTVGSARRVLPGEVLPSANFDQITFPQQNDGRSKLRAFDHLRFCLESKKLKAKQRAQLGQRATQLSAEFGESLLSTLHFPFVQNNSDRFIDRCSAGNVRSFFAVEPSAIGAAASDAFADFSASLNSPRAATLKDSCAPLLAKLVHKRASALAAAGLTLYFRPEVAARPDAFELLNAENFLLINAEPNPLCNGTESAYSRSMAVVEGVNVALIKRRKLQRDAPSFLLSRFLVRCRFGFSLQFRGRTEYQVTSPLDAQHFLLLEALYAQFDFRKYAKAQNPAQYVAARANPEAWQSLKIADVNFCLGGAPFHRVPGLV